MKYLFFDIECCDGNHICSFGYVIIDEKFNIIAKKDLVINPEKPFNLGRDKFNPRIQLAYQEYTFYKQKNFKYFYPTIKELLCNQEYVVLGHSISSDLQYLKIACERYDVDNIDIGVYDTQDFYYQLNKKYKTRSLENIINDLSIKVENLQEHKSCDDAEMSMLITKEICNRLNVSISDLLTLCESSIKDGNPKELSDRAKNKKFSKTLKAIAQKYPDRNNWKSICLSDIIVETDFEKRIQLIKRIFESGYNYICKVSECDYFVTANEYGERDLSCDYNIDNGKKIKKITIKDLSKMLGFDINEFGEIEKQEDTTNSEIHSLLLEALAKKGISYDNYIKSFSDNTQS